MIRRVQDVLEKLCLLSVLVVIGHSENVTVTVHVEDLMQRYESKGYVAGDWQKPPTIFPEHPVVDGGQLCVVNVADSVNSGQPRASNQRRRDRRGEGGGRNVKILALKKIKVFDIIRYIDR